MRRAIDLIMVKFLSAVLFVYYKYHKTRFSSGHEINAQILSLSCILGDFEKLNFPLTEYSVLLEKLFIVITINVYAFKSR